MAPSAVNDGVRGAMAALAMYRDDIAGAIVTAGTATGYTVASYSGYDTLAHLDGQMIAFTPHASNGATVTLNVDGLGAKPLRTSPGAELLAGVLVQGTPFMALFNNTDGAFYLRDYYGQPYQIPLGAIVDFAGATLPNSSFALPNGQAVNRVTYAALFSLIGTTYGVGDGSTTFNLPDCTGRVTAMKEATATRLTSTYFGGNSTAFGATGGAESQTLAASQIPTINCNVSASSITVFSGITGISGTAGPANFMFDLRGTGGGGTVSFTYGISGQTAASSNTGGGAHPIVQPTIVLNKIMRII